MTAAEKIARRAIWVGPPQFKPTRVLLKAETAGMGEHLKVGSVEARICGPDAFEDRATYALPVPGAGRL